MALACFGFFLKRKGMFPKKKTGEPFCAKNFQLFCKTVQQNQRAIGNGEAGCLTIVPFAG